jgi:hypothetical protein
VKHYQLTNIFEIHIPEEPVHDMIENVGFILQSISISNNLENPVRIEISLLLAN